MGWVTGAVWSFCRSPSVPGCFVQAELRMEPSPSQLLGSAQSSCPCCPVLICELFLVSSPPSTVSWAGSKLELIPASGAQRAQNSQGQWLKVAQEGSAAPSDHSRAFVRPLWLFCSNKNVSGDFKDKKPPKFPGEGKDPSIPGTTLLLRAQIPSPAGGGKNWEQSLKWHFPLLKRQREGQSILLGLQVVSLCTFELPLLAVASYFGWVHTKHEI